MRRFRFFIRLLIWFSIRSFKTHPARVLAVLAGIALGAAVFTSVRLAVNASLDSFTRSMDVIAGKADYSVIRPGGRVDEHLVAGLLKHRAVVTASPIITTYVKAVGEKGGPFLLIGLDPFLDRALREWDTSREGKQSGQVWLDLMREPYTLLLSQPLAEEAKAAGTGHVLRLEHVTQMANFRVLGILAPEGLASAEGGRVAITDIAAMQEFTGLYGKVDRIDLLLSPEANDRDIESIKNSLPEGVLLERPTEAKESGKLMIRAYQMNLSVLSFVSLFVGMFLVYSLVALNAASRRHELAILRSIGASSGTLFALFLSEGCLFGIAGWLLAIPLSSLLVRRLLFQVSETISTLFVRVQVNGLKLDIWEILLSLGMTVAISLAAAYQPARDAMRVAPREAMSMRGPIPHKRKSPLILAGLGAVLIASIYPISSIPSPPGVAFPGYIATFFLFAGFSLFAPWCLAFMGSHLPPLLRRIGGQPAYLAGRYMRDAGTRTSISVGALITAAALFVGLVIMVHSFRSSVELWVNQSISGDLFMRPKMAGVNQYRDPLPDDVVSYLKGLGDRAEVHEYRRIYLDEGNKQYQFECVDFGRLWRRARFLFIKGDPQAIEPTLIRGEGVIVSEVYANQMHKSVGDRYQAQVRNVKFDLPILGVFRDYRTQGGAVFYSFPAYEKLTGDRSWDGARLYMKGKPANPEKAALELKDEILDKFGQQHALEITSGIGLRRAILRIFDETFAVTTVLLLIALIVAALGITTTLAVLVLERALQLNILLAVGASFRQIRTMILWEAVLMVTAGIGVGLVCGFFLSILLNSVINRESFGWTFLYSVDWFSLLTAVPLIFVTALLSALPAARLVFRIQPALVLKEG